MWYAGGMKTFIANLKHLATHDLSETKESTSAHVRALDTYVKQLEAKIKNLEAVVDTLNKNLAAHTAAVLRAAKNTMHK